MTFVGRIYTELVRCPDHPEKEKEYVIQLEPDRIIFYNSESEDFSGDIEFEWTISVIKRVKYHNHIGKVEVEVGRYEKFLAQAIYNVLIDYSIVSANMNKLIFQFLGPQKVAAECISSLALQ